jgi:pimeloyl-ACP methyl ester carboxylesterase
MAASCSTEGLLMGSGAMNNLPPLWTTQLDGLRLAWREAGDGPAVVFLHGIGSGSAAWRHQLTHFALRHRAIAWDAPGYGGSGDLPPENPTAREYALALAQLLTDLEVERAVLVGNSLGALMAAAFVHDHPHRVRGLVLSDAASGHGLLEAGERQKRLAARLDTLETLGPAGMAEKRAPRLLGSKPPAGALEAARAVMAEVRPRGYAQAARMLSTANVFDELAGCEAPALVVCGSEDRVTPPADNERIAQALPGAQFTLIEGAGHLPYLEAPERFNAVVDGFLATLEQTAA